MTATLPLMPDRIRHDGRSFPLTRYAISASRTAVIQNLANPCMAGNMTKQRPTDLPPPVGTWKFIDFPVKFPAMLALAGKIGLRAAGNLLVIPEAAR
ncbi:MAG: hypothetical protein WC804_00655 [Sphingomonas sp.]|uniref:hypothetical protein n=1 Tax=Sphingomonas sp. TaxID=28214 RepID=UPI003563EB81